MAAEEPQLTGIEWTPNDYSNFITICAAAIGSTDGDDKPKPKPKPKPNINASMVSDTLPSA